MNYVFVYGTLKRGHGNYEALLNRPDVHFIGTAQTVNPYRMLHAGFPVLMKSNQDTFPALGEVFDIVEEDGPVTVNLDRLEGEGTMYKREKIPVDIHGIGTRECWAYFGCADYWRRDAIPTCDVIDGRYVWNQRRRS